MAGQAQRNNAHKPGLPDGGDGNRLSGLRSKRTDNHNDIIADAFIDGNGGLCRRPYRSWIKDWIGMLLHLDLQVGDLHCTGGFY